ncbi:hypothetical protein J2809_001148 [Arthrobacter pascens]|jgi:hypothetical protein|nr:hypothetical protein [Arthrobacter pascens]MDR6556806.1 hypothetical protein [Arthrobacter pascens]
MSIGAGIGLQKCPLKMQAKADGGTAGAFAVRLVRGDTEPDGAG